MENTFEKDLDKLRAFAVVAKQSSYKKALDEFAPKMTSKAGKEALQDITDAKSSMTRSVSSAYTKAFDKLYISEQKHIFKNLDQQTQKDIIKSNVELAMKGIIHPDILDKQNELRDLVTKNSSLSKEAAELKLSLKNSQQENSTLKSYLANLQANVMHKFGASKEEVKEMTVKPPEKAQDKEKQKVSELTR